MSNEPESVLNSRLLDEWKETRGLISKLDDTLSGLRKYGFSFITALLAADSILGQATSNATVTIMPEVKLAIFATTLILVAGLFATDNFYSVVQKGAAERAREIENHFNKTSPLLTHIISKFYRSRYLWLYVDGLYFCFVLAAETLGMIVLYPNYTLILFMTIATALTLLFVILLPRAGNRPNLWES